MLKLLIGVLADFLAVDLLFKLWQVDLPLLWWQVLAMVIGDLVLGVIHHRSVRIGGRQTRSSRTLGALILVNRLGMISISLASMTP